MKKFLYLFYLVGFNSFGQVDSINSGTNNNNNQAIPFNWVEQIPLLENCKLLEKNLQKDCMVSSLELHIKNTLQYPEEAKKVKVESKVFTSFIINKDGEITKLEVNGKPTSFKKAFENEARRIINALPKFIPGRHKNERVDVQVMLPVEFALEELKKKIEVREVTSEPLSVEASDIAEEYLEDYAIPFAVVEQIPLFKSCKKKESNTQRDCFQEEIKKHIKKHLKYPKEAKKNKIEARVHVIFEIDNQGKTVNVKTRSNQKGNYGNLFEQESKRIISKLPNFTPAMQRGKAVKVSYIIPINFKL